MMKKICSRLMRRAGQLGLALLLLVCCLSAAALAHPLGNFTVNHFARLEVGAQQVRVRYVVDMAEISTFQELQSLRKDGAGAPSNAELNAYLARVVRQYAEGLRLTVDGSRIALEPVTQHISLPAGAGNLPTLRVECEMAGVIPSADAESARRMRFEDTNHAGRIGWHELVLTATPGISVFDSNAHANALTDELKSYPSDMLNLPLDERVAELSFAPGAMPAGAAPLRTRDGRTLVQSRDRLAELIAVPKLTWGIALFGLLLAAALGAVHALSPGHGKTVVGAYLVGSRGTARHALFLGLTVTVTHTLGVFALGLATLFASRYVMPETLLPVLSLLSGAIVLALGVRLFARRLRAALGHQGAGQHGAGHAHEHTDEHEEHTHNGRAHEGHTHDGLLAHSHGGSTHTHLPPGADGRCVTWRSLLALGISGGLLPCPSALVVLLSAISLQRIGFGLILVLAFSIGLAATLTSIGLIFVYAGRLMKHPLKTEGGLVRWLPCVSALVIACIGAAICYEALAQAGPQAGALLGHLFGKGEGEAGIALGQALGQSWASAGALAVLGLGLVFGLKHATEVDHVVAVSTIVSEHRNVLRAALVGGLWGIGHTASLVIVGALVLVLRVGVPEGIANWLEFAVALMIVGLGANAFLRALRARAGAHLHLHSHDGMAHAHLHFHDEDAGRVDIAHERARPLKAHAHAIRRVGLKPALVGAMHGLAGSAALTLLVLTQIESIALGLLYLAVFGLGSIIGMLLMSGLIGLPFAYTARRVNGLGYGLQTTAGALSIAFGLWYAYETGIASGLLKSII